MNMKPDPLTPEDVLFAVGEVIKDERNRHDAQLNAAIAEALTKIEPGQPGEPGRDADPAQVAARILELVKMDDTVAELMRGLPGRDGVDGKSVQIEELAQHFKADALVMAALRGEKGERGDEGRKGDKGDAADPYVIAGIITRDAEFLTKVTPVPLDPMEIVERLLESSEFTKLVTPDAERIANTIMDNAGFAAKLRAPDPDIDALTKAATDLLKADASFRAACKGDPAEPEEVASALTRDPDFIGMVKAKDADPAEVAALLAANEDFRKQCKGADANPLEVASLVVKTEFLRMMVEASIEKLEIKAIEALKADPEFQERIRGEKGDRGLQGERGADGADASPEDVAKALAADELFVHRTRGLEGQRGEKGDTGDRGEPGEKGADAQPEDVAKALAADEAFVARTRGPQGDKGDAGENGSDSDPDDVARILKDLIISDPDAVIRIKGDQGEPGTDAPLIEPFVIKLGQRYEKNGVGVWDGGLWLAKRIAHGSPEEDPAAWMNVCNGFAGFKARFDGTLRQHVFEIKQTDGSTIIYKFDDAAKHVRDADAAYIPGDWFIEKNAEGEGITFCMLWDGAIRKFPLVGAKGDRGRKGAKGEPGNGFLLASLSPDGDMLLTMDDGQQIEVEGFAASLEQRALGALTKDPAMLRRIVFERDSEITTPILNFAGQWRHGETYLRGDVVQDGSGVFIAKGRTTAELHNPDAWFRMISTPAPSKYRGPLHLSTQAENVDHHVFDFGEDMKGRAVVDFHLTVTKKTVVSLAYLCGENVLDDSAELSHSGQAFLNVGGGKSIHIRVEIGRVGDHTTVVVERTCHTGSIARVSRIFSRKQFPTCGGLVITAADSEFSLLLGTATVE